MSTTSRGTGNGPDLRDLSIILLLIVVDCAKAIDYAAYRTDAIPRGVSRDSARTTRDILEELNLRSASSSHDLQDGTEHVLQYGALLRTQILDTFGKLVYDHYDDFGMSQIEALYRIYRDTLERKYNIFDIVPMILNDPDTRPTRICTHINERIRTCLKESSESCMNIRIHDEPHPDTMSAPALNVTRQIYRLSEIAEHYPNGFSLDAVLDHLRDGRIRFTPALFSGLLHNVQYDSFDDRVRTAERELILFLNRSPRYFPTKTIEDASANAGSVSQLLKSYLTHNERIFSGKAAEHAAYLAQHVVREIDSVSENIELLGTVYDNASINLGYLFKLILPDDVVDQDVREARDYLFGAVAKGGIMDSYLRVEKYQQAGPDQLLMEILGQLRDIEFAVDIVTSLHAHARFWHRSHMIENLNELLELFDAYDNLRGLPDFAGLMEVADTIRSNLRDSRNVTVELLCSRPRVCLRIGLEIVSNCSIVNEETKKAIEEFVKRTTCGCSCLVQDSQVIIESTTSKKRNRGDATITTSQPSIGSAETVNSIKDISDESTVLSTFTESISKTIEISTSSSNFTSYDDDADSTSDYSSDYEEPSSEENWQESTETTEVPGKYSLVETEEEESTERPCEGDCGECNGANCTPEVAECTGTNCSSVACTSGDCLARGNCTGAGCDEREKCEGPLCRDREIGEDSCDGSDCEPNGTGHCTSPDCLVNLAKTPVSEDGEGPDCDTMNCGGDEKSSGSNTCENDDCEIRCEGDDCENSCTGDDCGGSSCDADDCKSNSTVGIDYIGPNCADENNQCQGPNCTAVGCLGDGCIANELLIGCKGPNCTEGPIVENCTGDNCSSVSCEGDGCKKDSCEGDACEISSCEGDACEISSCEGDACEISSCEGDACEISSCEGDECGSSSCEGDECDSSSCEGDGCKSDSPVGKGCVGPICAHANNLCPGPNCSTTGCVGNGCKPNGPLIGCEGIDCPMVPIIENCDGDDCGSGSCEGDDCGSGSCEGDDCGSGSCEGDDCGSDSCEGDDCEISSCEGDKCDSSSCEGNSCTGDSAVEMVCVGPNCADTNNLCEGPNCPATGCVGDGCKVNEPLTDCNGTDCAEGPIIENCEDPDCFVKAEGCDGLECLDGGAIKCRGDDCRAESAKTDCAGGKCPGPASSLKVKCEGSKCPGNSAACTGDNCSMAPETCSGPDCFANSAKLGSYERNDTQLKEKDDSCEGEYCLDDSSEAEDCKDSECSVNTSININCNGPTCDVDSKESTCEGSSCSSNSVESCEGPDCSGSESDGSADCEGEDCSGSESDEGPCKGLDCSERPDISCYGENCPTYTPSLTSERNRTENSTTNDDGNPTVTFCEGPNCSEVIVKDNCDDRDCSIDGEVVKTDCEGADCSEIIVEDNCDDGDCSIDGEVVRTDCEGADCSEIIVEDNCDDGDCSIDGEVVKPDCEGPSCHESNVKVDCKGARCPVCKGLNCTEITDISCLGENCPTHNPRLTEESNPTEISTNTSRPNQTVIFCDNADPHYRRKLKRLQKMRRIDADSSTPRTWSTMFAVPRPISDPSKTSEAIKSGQVNGSKNPLLQMLGIKRRNFLQQDNPMIPRQLSPLRSKNHTTSSRHHQEDIAKALRIANRRSSQQMKNILSELGAIKVAEKSSAEASIKGAKGIRGALKVVRQSSGERFRMKTTESSEDEVETGDDSNLKETLLHRRQVEPDWRKVRGNSQRRRMQKFEETMKKHDGDWMDQPVERRAKGLQSNRGASMRRRVAGTDNRKVSRRAMKLRIAHEEVPAADEASAVRRTESRRSDPVVIRSGHIVHLPKARRSKTDHHRVTWSKTNMPISVRLQAHAL